MNGRTAASLQAMSTTGTNPFRTCIFDFGGVVVDSEPVHAEAKRKTLDQYRIAYSPTIFDDRWQETAYVFTTSLGSALDAATVTRAFQRALERAGLPHSRFHDLRHNAATYLLAQGFRLQDVKNLLGYSSITLTSNTYGHVLEQRQQQVAAGMDAIFGA